MSHSAQLIAEVEARKAYTRSRAERINRYVMGHGSLLEIGSGTGALLVELRQLGWQVEGIEPSPLLNAHATGQLGKGIVHHCQLSVAEKALHLKPYQAIAALDVIEHLPDPFLLPRKAFDWLTPGGYLFLQTPNVDSLRHRKEGAGWEQLAPGEHCILHSARSLRMVIEQAGLRVEEMRTLSGGAIDSFFRRMWMRPAETGLNLLGLGNALWAVARKGRN